MATIRIVHALMADGRWACDVPRGVLIPGAAGIDLDGVTCDGCFVRVAVTRLVKDPQVERGSEVTGQAGP